MYPFRACIPSCPLYFVISSKSISHLIQKHNFSSYFPCNAIKYCLLQNTCSIIIGKKEVIYLEEITIGNRLISIELLKTSYFSIKSTLIIQLRIRVRLNNLQLIYQLDTFINSAFISNKNVQLRLLSSIDRSSDKVKLNYLEDCLRNYGLLNIFNMFKQDVFNSIESELDKNPNLARYRQMLLPI